MPGPDVTVIVPTRDRWSLASRAIGCALRQRDVEIEVIVVDDGSTKRPPSGWPGERDPRVRLVRNPESLGLAGARNRAIEEAGAEWLAFLDDDDIWSPDKLRRQLAVADERSAEFVYSSAYLLDEHLRVLAMHHAARVDRLTLTVFDRNPIPAAGSNVIVRTKALMACGGFDEQFHQLADLDLSIRLAGELPMAALRDPLVGYTQHSGNMAATTRARDWDLMVEWKRLRRKHRRLERERGRRFNTCGVVEWYLTRLQLGGRSWRAAAVGVEWGIRLREGSLIAAGLRGITRDGGYELPPPSDPPSWWEPE